MEINMRSLVVKRLKEVFAIHLELNILIIEPFHNVGNSLLRECEFTLPYAFIKIISIS